MMDPSELNPSELNPSELNPSELNPYTNLILIPFISLLKKINIYLPLELWYMILKYDDRYVYYKKFEIIRKRFHPQLDFNSFIKKHIYDNCYILDN